MVVTVLMASLSGESSFAMGRKKKSQPEAPAQSAPVKPAAPAAVKAPAYVPENRYETSKFDFEDLKKLLKDNKNIKSVDDVIPLLPESYRKYYTLAYKSTSRQGGIPESPRVIAYGAPLAGSHVYPYEGEENVSHRSDNLLIAFKSDPSLKFGLVPEEDDLEVFEWIPGHKAWVAHDVTFPNRKSERAELNDEERYQVSEDNPKECRRCHRYPEMRPNWEAYPRWPGMFGSNAGPYYTAKEKGQFDEETAALKLFSEKTKDLARLKMLSPFPYSDDQAGHDQREFINIRITSKIATLNFKRVQRMIEERPDYPKLKYAIYAGMGRCANFPSFLSDSLRSHVTLNYDELLKETRDVMNRSEFHFRIGDAEYNYQDLERQARAVTNMRYLFEGALGEDIDPWFTNIERNQYRANFAGSVATTVGGELASAFYLDPRYQSFKLNLYAVEQPEANCSVLREISLGLQGR